MSTFIAASRAHLLSALTVGRTLMLSALAMVVGLGMAAPAWAVDVGAERHHGLTTQGDIWWGTYEFDSGRIAVCADSLKHGPRSTDVTYSDFQEVRTFVHNDLLTNPSGLAATPQALHQIAYLMSRYAQTTDNSRAASIDLANKHLLGHPNYDLFDSSSAGYAYAVEAGVLTQARALVTEAQRLAGPYTHTLVTTPAAGSTSVVGAPGTATYRAVNSAGEGLPGVTVTFTITAPGGGSTVVTGTTDTTGRATAPVPANTNGAWAVKADAANIPTLWPFLTLPDDPDRQRLWLAGETTTWSGDAAFTKANSTPRATTRSSAVIVKPGDPVHDIVQLSGGTPGEAFSGTSTLYGPLEQEPASPTAEAPAGTPIAGVGTYTGTYGSDGTAEVKTTQVMTAQGTSSSYYVWQEEIAGTATSQPFKGKYGVATEITLAYNPDLSTKIQSQTARVGDTVSDTVIHSGIKTSVGGKAITNTVTGVWAGPLAPVDSKCADLDWSTAATRPIKPFVVTTDGETTGVDEHVVDVPGCGTYGEKLTVTVQGEDKPVLVVDHPAGHVTQTVLVDLYRPIGNTKVTNTNPAAGEAVSDVWYGQGGKPGTTQQGVWARYDITGLTGDALKCTDGNLVEEGTFEITYGDDGTGTTKPFGTYTAAADGKVYTYVDALTADDFNAQASHDCGLPEETVTHPDVPAPPAPAVIASGVPGSTGWNLPLLAGAALGLLAGMGALVVSTRRTGQA